MTVTRVLVPGDAPGLGELLRRNRTFLASWQPLRSEGYYTDEGQQEAVDKAVHQHESGSSLPLVIVGRQDTVVGTMTLQSIILGSFQSCSVGYWLAKDAQGQGVVQYGVAESCMKIAGKWQVNLLYQLLTPTPERVVTD